MTETEFRTKYCSELTAIPAKESSLTKPTKQTIESRVREMILDALDVRAEEILSRGSLPIDKLLMAAVKLLPTVVESKGEVVHSFAEMIKMVHMERANGDKLTVTQVKK